MISPQTLLSQNPSVLVTFASLIGIIIGSFLNVVIHRLPKMMEQAWKNELEELQGKASSHPTYNLLTPQSSCPACNNTIRFYENIPIISYLALKGKCSYCAHPISLRYPAIELLSGLLTGYIAWQFGWSIYTIAASIFALSMLTLTCIDLETQLLPDNITLPLIWLGLIFNIHHEFTAIESAVMGAILGYLVLWGVYWIFKLITHKEGMGYGDFKMLAAIGAWLGIEALPLVIVIASFTASIVGITLILLKKQNRASTIPFGPYLALSAMILLFNTSTLTRWIGS
jgi:leader peptidase (prepilin peptidase)/N-methyltransferase